MNKTKQQIEETQKEIINLKQSLKLITDKEVRKDIFKKKRGLNTMLSQLENELFEKELYSFRDEYLELLQSKYNEFIEDYPYEFGNYDVVFLNEPNLKAVVRTLKTNYIDLKIKMWIGGGSGYDCGNGFGNFSFYVFREAGISAEILKRKPFRIVGFSDKKEI